MKDVYLDHSATTVVDKRVIDAMLPYFTEEYGNASSLHSKGRKAHQTLEESRKTVAEFINANPREIIFTGGGTESDNIAVKGVAYYHQRHKCDMLKQGKKYHIITSSIEHPAIRNTCEHLEEIDFDVTYLSVNKYGIIDIEELKQSIRDETILITIIFASNEIGTIQPIKEIGKIAKQNNIIFHTDAVQAVGKVRIDVNDLNIDVLSMSAHKLHGPKGIGALYVRKGVKLEPIIHGGGHEFGLRSSTENIPGIVGLAKAYEILQKDMDNEILRMKNLRDKLINGILTKIKDSYLNGHPTQRLPNNVCVGIKYIEGESMMLKLDMLGIYVSTGSACSSKSLEPSKVLLAIGLKPVDAHGSLRITLGRFTTEKEIDYFLEKLPPIVKELRDMSPLAK